MAHSMNKENGMIELLLLMGIAYIAAPLAAVGMMFQITCGPRESERNEVAP